MLCYGMIFALIEITYCTTIYYTCGKLFENHTLGVTSVATTLEYAFELCLWFRKLEFWFCGPGNSVGIATGYELDDPGIESR
jgi:hypothetical protein